MVLINIGVRDATHILLVQMYMYLYANLAATLSISNFRKTKIYFAPKLVLEILDCSKRQVLWSHLLFLYLPTLTYTQTYFVILKVW